MDSFCSSCGHPRIAEAKFCSSCGSPFDRNLASGMDDGQLDSSTTETQQTVPTSFALETPEAASSQQSRGNKRWILLVLLVVAGTLAAVASSVTITHNEQGTWEPSGPPSSMTRSAWGFNAPEILSANSESFWIFNQGGGTVACTSYATCQETPSSLPAAVMKFNASSGNLVKALTPQSCPSTITLNAKVIGSTCGIAPFVGGRPSTIHLDPSSCSVLHDGSRALIAADARYVWFVVAPNDYVEVDGATGHCGAIRLPLPSILTASYPTALADGVNLWITTPSLGPSEMFKVNESTRQISLHRSSLSSVRSNLITMNGHLWFVGTRASAKMCQIYGRQQPCVTRFVLQSLETSTLRPAETLDSPRYGLGDSPTVDGFGTLSLSESSNDLWVAATDASQVTEVRESDGAVLRTLRPDRTWQPIQVVAGGGYFYVDLLGVQGVDPELVDQFSMATGKLVRQLRGPSA